MTIQLKDLEPHDSVVATEAIIHMQQGIQMPVHYDDTFRLVEVHAVGVSTSGKPCMRVYQVAGETHSGEQPGWKMMSLDKVELVGKSGAPRQGYKKGDKGMGTIFKQI